MRGPISSCSKVPWRSSCHPERLRPFLPAPAEVRRRWRACKSDERDDEAYRRENQKNTPGEAFAHWAVSLSGPPGAPHRWSAGQRRTVLLHIHSIRSVIVQNLDPAAVREPEGRTGVGSVVRLHSCHYGCALILCQQRSGESRHSPESCFLRRQSHRPQSSSCLTSVHVHRFAGLFIHNVRKLIVDYVGPTTIGSRPCSA